MKLQRWTPPSVRCINVGLSTNHASTVPLVLNPASGYITTQNTSSACTKFSSGYTLAHTLRLKNNFTGLPSPFQQRSTAINDNRLMPWLVHITSIAIAATANNKQDRVQPAPKRKRQSLPVLLYILYKDTHTGKFVSIYAVSQLKKDLPPSFHRFFYKPLI